MIFIETERLNLRQWQQDDYAEFAKLTSNAEVMKYFPSTLTTKQSDKGVERCKSSIKDKGFGFWAAELKQSNEFIGFIGISDPGDGYPFSPCIEIGWRLAQRFWGKGYASEGAKASLEFAFNKLGLNEIISMTPVLNINSKKVMQRIGMQDSKQNFIHPKLIKTNELAEHVLYKITSEQWQAMQS